MKHKSIHKDLIFFLEGELSAQRQKEMNEHLEKCADCREYADFLKSSLAIIEEEKKQNLNPFFYQKLNTKLKNRIQESKRFEFRHLLQPAFFSLLLFAGIVLGLKMGAQITNEQTAGNSSSEMYYFNELGDEPIESYFLN